MRPTAVVAENAPQHLGERICLVVDHVWNAHGGPFFYGDG
jgi:hypothetical protein